MDILIRSFITPVGELLLGSYHGALCLCDWKERRSRDAVDRRLQRGIGVRYKARTSPVIEQAMDQFRLVKQGQENVAAPEQLDNIERSLAVRVVDADESGDTRILAADLLVELGHAKHPGAVALV